MVASGLLAWVAISKYLEHLPLYRLKRIAARLQVILPCISMNEWIGLLGVALNPLANRLNELRAVGVTTPFVSRQQLNITGLFSQQITRSRNESEPQLSPQHIKQTQKIFAIETNIAIIDVQYALYEKWINMPFSVHAECG